MDIDQKLHKPDDSEEIHQTQKGPSDFRISLYGMDIKENVLMDQLSHLFRLRSPTF